MDEDTETPVWAVQARNGYYAVDEHRGESGRTYGDPLIFTTRRDATKVAEALNAAYARGWTDGVGAAETRQAEREADQ